MDERHRKLISLLRQSVRPVSGKRLAAELGVTTRSIINYVHAINASAGQNLISSSSQGYSLCQDVSVANERPSTPQSHADRQAYLAKALLIDHPGGINAIDLSDELIVSYSLLKREVLDFNGLCSGLGVSIVSRGNMLSVVGSEHDKRRLITTVIRKQQGDAMLSIDDLRGYFGDDMVRPILSVINRNTIEVGIYINDFARLNLALHIAIAVSRVRNGNALPDESGGLGAISASIQAGPVAKAIADEIEGTFKVILNASDYNQILMLAESHVHASSAEPRHAGSDATQRQMDDLEDIMRQVKECYYLGFTSREFLVPVSLHVTNLLMRLEHGIHVDNPIKETFRDSSPFLYDIASYVIGEVLARNGMSDVTADDNELTFLVMYLALELQRQQQDDGMTRVLFYFPSYSGIETGLAEKIRVRFSDQAKVVGRVSSEGDIEAGTYDVLITFVGLERPVSGRVVRISPVPTQRDWGRMGVAITQV